MPAPRPHVNFHTQALFKETTVGTTHGAFGISPEGQHVSRNICVHERVIARLHPNLTSARVGYLAILRAVQCLRQLPRPRTVEPCRYLLPCAPDCRDHWHGWDATFTTEHQVCAETLSKFQHKSMRQLARSLKDVPDGDLVEEILFRLKQFPNRTVRFFYREEDDKRATALALRGICFLIEKLRPKPESPDEHQNAQAYLELQEYAATVEGRQ